jgi:glutamate receptor, ionotropic, invertebrate
MTAEKDDVIDFIIPYIEQTGISIGLMEHLYCSLIDFDAHISVLKQPVLETSLFKFMTVFKLEVWIALLVSVTLSSFLMFVLERFSPYSFFKNPARYPYPCRTFDLKECFWFTLTSFTPQGGGEPPKVSQFYCIPMCPAAAYPQNLSARILVTAYWLFVVLMLATFTANLAAFLTVEKMQVRDLNCIKTRHLQHESVGQVPISSMEQLGRQSKILYSFVNDSIASSYFYNMNEAEKTLYK